MKTFTKRFTATLLCLLMAFPISAEEEVHDHSEVTEITAEEAATSGMIGESNVAWSFDTSTGRMNITGNGGCSTFTSADDQPWAEYREQITEVWFMDMDSLSITDISYWFDGCTSLVTAEIPYTTSVIGERAFADCPSLETVMFYYTDQTFTIGANAFETDELSMLELRYIPASESTFEILAGYDWIADNRRPSYTDVYGMMVLATSYCFACGETCRYTEEYEPWTDTYHNIRWWCSNCGDDMNEGTNAERHEMEYGVCIWCGYEDEDYECPHDYTDTDWYGCEWEEYCEDCGEFIDSGIDHGYTETDWNGCEWTEYCEDCGEVFDEGVDHARFTYDDWEYYSSTRHRRFYGCPDCGEGDYEYDYHSTSTEYSQYSSTQHEEREYCEDCSTTVDSSYESHSFSYGTWTNYDGTQHRRTATCYTCGYSTYEYAGHSLTNGSWKSYNSTQHYRTKSCSCGYSTTEYANHSLTYGSWANYSATQHRRTVSCATCGYSTYEYANHSITTGSWSSISATQHSRTKSCSCGYSTTETESHSLSYGEWITNEGNDYSTTHKRTVSCSCGYSITEYEKHNCYGIDDWQNYNENEHTRHEQCDCGYKRTIYSPHKDTTTKESVSDPEHNLIKTCDECGRIDTTSEPHEFTYSDWEYVSEEQHQRVKSCSCGYSADVFDSHQDSDDDGTCDDCDYLMLCFSVTVPATLNLTVSKEGTVYAASSAQIVNNSMGAVSVTNVMLNTENGWEIVPYSTNMANTKVDAKLIGFYLNGAESDGSDYLTLSNNWQINKNDALDLTYDAVVSATSDPINEQVLTVVFVLGWTA